MNCIRKTCGILSLSAGFAALAAPAHAQLWAYEGFSGVSDGALSGTLATGSGFDGTWVITNGSGGASTTEAAGLSYPVSYQGSNSAVGGNGRVTGASGDNAFLALDFSNTTSTAVNGASKVYMGWLAQNVAVSATDDLVNDWANRTSVREQFNLAAEYPRNSGVRIMSQGVGSNSALGMIGNSGNWNGNNQSVFGSGDSGPEVVDTWGAFNFNDANNIFVGNGGAGPGEPDPSTAYNPAGANYLAVAHLVLEIDTATSTYFLQVNPQIDGSNDGSITWQHTDGDPVAFVMEAFGVEAGNNSSERAVGDMVFDEIYIGGTFADVAGFTQVPEPSTYALLVGIAGLGFVWQRRRRQKASA